MSDDKNVRVLSAQEIEEIMALPDRKFIIAGIERKGKFNQQTGIFYLLNDDGTLNGRIARTTRRDRPPSEEMPESGKDNRSAPASEKEAGTPPKAAKFSLAALLHKLAGDTAYTDTPDNKVESRLSGNGSEDDQANEAKPNKKKLFGLAGGLVIVALLAAFVLPRLSDRTTPPDDVSLPDSSLETIDVIQVTHDLIPGDIISEDNVQRASISAETYNQIYLDSSQLYQWSRCEALTGDRVVTYIPRGQYLTYDNVASVYLQPANPWYSDVDGTTYVTIPLTEDILNRSGFSYGSVVNLTVTKQTVKEIDKPENDEQAAPSTDIPGLDHQMSVQQSYVVDTYGMTDIVICDLLNKEQNSLYSTYTSWISIPTGERLTYARNRLNDDDALVAALAPAYAKIRISNEQAAELGDLTGDNISIAFIDRETVDNDTEVKAAYAAEVRALQTTIAEAAALNAKAAEEAANG